MKFGAHMSTSGGVWKALERGEGIGCEVVQIFVKNNMQWFAKPYAPDDAERFKTHLAKSKVRAVFGHAGYLINLAAPACDNRDKSIRSLTEEIRLADQLGVPFLVLHPGAHLGAGVEAGVANVVAALNGIFTDTRSSTVRIALENTAGQGTTLGHKLAELAAIFDGVERTERLGLCLDTAHFFAAGYDLREPAGWKSATDEVEKLMGLDQILAFHLNDSKTEFGSRVDRHAGIGQGKLGRAAFAHIVNDQRFANLPGCLETPKSDDLHEDVENLAILRSLVSSAATTKQGSLKSGRAKENSGAIHRSRE